MKFSEMIYQRPDIEQLKAVYADILASIENAQTAEEQFAAVDRFNEVSGHISTAENLAMIRHSIDTKDEFYDRENDFVDESMPLLEEPEKKIYQALLGSKFRDALEKKYGRLLFTDLEIAARSFKPELVELRQKENKLSSDYQKLYASAIVEFDGKKLTLPKLGPYQQSTDRAVRKAAYVTFANWFDSHREELDELYDALVKNRDEQGRVMGYDNFIPLGYDRMGRNCYGPKEVAAFREQIAHDVVPLVAKVKKAQEKRLGVDKLMFWDDALLFPDGNPVPQGTADDILAAGLSMYRQLSPETAEFIGMMYDGGLLDVLSKEGKAPGGYCTEIYDYRSPFIFSNFNGTSADVDVLTHEAGHAFESWRAMGRGYLLQQIWPTMEACEIHSMSMEFLTAPYHHLFFGDATRKYELAHCEESLTFIPYGCMVDEFQHVMYENPTLTPEQRNGVWMDLEKKYRPWTDFGDLPFYSRGALWQRQTHIFGSPFYYIDYCMAQTVAFQFWMASLADREDAWKRYLALVDKGGTQTFEDLVRGAGLKVPYEPGCMKEISESVGAWLDGNQLS
ncbi:MAG: M3 family oligoendopeptidase [Ruminococcaceae bacterium]|nr:M3 family oligoendopeptidase [Oscillospiraceae bacterium]